MKLSFSLNRLIANLINQPNQMEYISLPDEEIKPTTIRLEPCVRKFCEEQANKLGTSYQSFITMVLKGVMLESTQPVKSEAILMYERFIELFQCHNVAIANIPLVLKKFNLPLSTIVDQNKMLDRFTPELFDFLHNNFFVDVEWLKGRNASERSSPSRWYKNLYSFCSDLLILKAKNLNPHVLFLDSDKTNLLEHDASKPENEVGLVIKLQNDYHTERQYYYYQVCESGAWDYWRSRQHLKVIMLFCNICHISHIGTTLKYDTLKEICHYPFKFIPRISKGRDFFGYRSWYPEDYISHYREEYGSQKDKDEAKEVYSTFFQYQLDKLILEQEFGECKISLLEKLRLAEGERLAS